MGKKVSLVSVTILWCVTFAVALHDLAMGICMGVCFAVALGLFNAKNDDDPDGDLPPAHPKSDQDQAEEA